MRRLFGVACLLVAACSQSPSSPSQPPASPPAAPIAFAEFSGYWSGTFHYTGCYTPKCWVMEHDEPFSLRLRQAAGRVTGVFAMSAGNIEVSGDVQPDGSLALDGFESTGGTKGPSQTTFKARGLRLDLAKGLQGSMRFDRKTSLSDLDWSTFYADGSIVSATYQGLDAVLADLSGTWKGLYLVQQCSDQASRPYCGLFRPGEVEYLELRVTVAGSTASGELIPVGARIPVNGAARDKTLELAGMLDLLSGRIIDRIEGLAVSVDEFGRLKGTFHYVRSGDGVLSTADVQLIQVVKAP